MCGWQFLKFKNKCFVCVFHHVAASDLEHRHKQKTWTCPCCICSSTVMIYPDFVKFYYCLCIFLFTLDIFCAVHFPFLCLSLSLTHTHTELHPLLHQWLSPSLPLTSQQAVFHLPQIAPVCHPKLCLQSCLPTPLQHMAHLIGLKTLFWIRKRGSCIIIRNIQMKHRDLIGISGGVEKDRVTFYMRSTIWMFL